MKNDALNTSFEELAVQEKNRVDNTSLQKARIFLFKKNI